jgi:hypothetical protein
VREALTAGVAAHLIEPVRDSPARGALGTRAVAGVTGSRAVEAPPAVTEDAAASTEGVSVHLVDVGEILARHLDGTTAIGLTAIVLPLLILGALARVPPRRLEARTCGFLVRHFIDSGSAALALLSQTARGAEAHRPFAHRACSACNLERVGRPRRSEMSRLRGWSGGRAARSLGSN